MKKTWIWFGILFVVATCGSYFAWSAYQFSEALDGLVYEVRTFDECVSAGYATEESNPARCVTPKGVVFTGVSVAEIATSSLPVEEPIPVPVSSLKAFAIPHTIAQGDTIQFTDGLKVSLKEITDSRCPKDVMCVWQGEQGVVLALSDGNAGDDAELRLGSETAPTLAHSGYTFVLGAVTTNSATITVQKAITASTGTVTGTVTIGPVCPVERVDNPCGVPPEVYTSRSVVVYQADKATVLTTQNLNAIGTYSLNLMPGSYWLQIDPAGIGAGEMKLVTVSAGVSSTVNFDIDTGIR